MVDPVLIQELIDMLKGNTAKDVIRVKANEISNSTDSIYIKGLMGSLFDNLSPRDVLKELEAIKKGFNPDCDF